MLIPILNGLAPFFRAPVTWVIFFIQLGVFVFSLVFSFESETTIDSLLQDDHFLSVQGNVYAQYVQENSHNVSPLVRDLASKASAGIDENYKLLGSLANRNYDFMNEADNLQFTGDQVEFRHWQRDFALLRSSQERHANYLLGLSADDVEWPRWITYSFAHSGIYHLLGNMYFMLLFGSMLEPIIGGLALLLLFVLSSMFGAGVFLLLSGASATPLIGASGAVSGLMVVFCLYFWHAPVRFAYAVLPSSKYMGLIYLPAWVLMVIFVCADLAGYFGAMNELGGVAYTAHLGGELAALLIGLIIFLIRRQKITTAQADLTPPLWHPVSMDELLKHYYPNPRG